MNNGQCLSNDMLRKYLGGECDEPSTLSIETHLAQCATCEQTIVVLELDSDTFVESMRSLKHSESQAKFKTPEPASVVKRAVAVARRLPELATVPEFPFEKPRQIGAYDLLKPLGRGGMGMVVLARHRTLQKEVAIKILPSLANDRPEVVSRFEREIRASGRLNHPAIVNATDAGQEQGTHYLVMEHISGLDLSRIARNAGPLPIADACELIRQAALGLSYAHAEGIVHRDIKPSNLMLDSSGRVKILDFGLAQLSFWDESTCELTTVGQLMGTLDYMAPEQAERSGPVDYRADLYSLGATLFRLIAGRAPLAAAPNMTLLEKVRLLGSQSAPLLSSLCEDCPEPLVELVRQLLNRDPTARPASAAHVAEALSPLCQGNALTDLLLRAQTAEADKKTATPEVLQASKLQRTGLTDFNSPPRRRWWLAAALLPIALMAGILITLETQKGQLVIQSDVADVHVKVIRDGKPVDEIEVHSGVQSTRLRADKYEIVIDNPSNAFVVDKQQVLIKSGETVVATIRHSDRAAPSAQGSVTRTDPVAAIDPNAIMYEGLSYAEWMHRLSADLSPEKQLEAIKAITAFADRQKIDEARPLLIKILTGVGDSAPDELLTVGFRALRRCFDSTEQYYEFLAGELVAANSSWRAMILLEASAEKNIYALAPLISAAIGILDSEKKDIADSQIFDLLYFVLAREVSIPQDLRREVSDALLKSASGNLEFLSRHAAKLEWLELIKLRKLVAEKVLNDPASTTRQNYLAIKILKLDRSLDRLRWVEPFMTRLLSESDRLTRFFNEGNSFFSANELRLTTIANRRLEVNQVPSLRIEKNGTAEIHEVLNLLIIADDVEFLRPSIERVLAVARATCDDNDLSLVKRSGSHNLEINDAAWYRLSADHKAMVLVAFAAKALLEKWGLSQPSIDSPPAVPIPSPAGENLDRKPAENLYGGKPLKEWLNLFERDRELAGRRSALAAIASLSKEADSQPVTNRLLDVLRKSDFQAKELSIRPQSNSTAASSRDGGESTLFNATLSCLRAINSSENFRQIVTEKLFAGTDDWTSQWLLAMSRESGVPVDEVLLNWILLSKNFQKFKPNSASLASNLVQRWLGSDPVAAKQHVHQFIECLTHHPSLGLEAILAVEMRQQAAFRVFDESQTEVARTVMANERSTPSETARAACHLATTTTGEDLTSQMLPLLRKRFQHLVHEDPARLKSMLATGLKSRFGFGDLWRPFRFMPRDTISRETTTNRNYKRFIPAESLALLALTYRLEAWAELDDELTALLLATSKEFETVIAGPARISSVPKELFPYSTANLLTVGEPWSQLPVETYLAWAIQETMLYFRTSNAVGPKLRAALLRAQLKKEFITLDDNSDAFISAAELEAHSSRDFMQADSSGDKQLSFEEYFFAFSQRRDN